MSDLSNTPTELARSLDSAIRSMSAAHDLDPRWIPAIIWQESAWKSLAVRYEANYSYLFHPERFTSPLISLSTEVNTQKTSWGLGQIMGALAREQGHKGFMAELLIPEINIKHMAIRLAELKKRTSLPDYIFAGYNGGIGAMRKQASGLFINQKYVTQVNRFLVKEV